MTSTCTLQRIMRPGKKSSKNLSSLQCQTAVTRLECAMKHWRNKVLLFSAAAILLLMLFLRVIDPSVLRPLLAVPLVLFLPGFALTVILFERERLGIPERLMLSVGLSVALTALVGLLLNWTRLGLWTMSLGTA